MTFWTPRPARVKYGMALTRALLRHMQDLSRLRGARFEILMTPAAPGPKADVPMALVHDGHWFLADPATHEDPNVRCLLVAALAAALRRPQ